MATPSTRKRSTTSKSRSVSLWVRLEAGSSMMRMRVFRDNARAISISGHWPTARVLTWTSRRGAVTMIEGFVEGRAEARASAHRNQVSVMEGFPDDFQLLQDAFLALDGVDRVGLADEDGEGAPLGHDFLDQLADVRAGRD